MPGPGLGGLGCCTGRICGIAEDQCNAYRSLSDVTITIKRPDGTTAGTGSAPYCYQFVDGDPTGTWTVEGVWNSCTVTKSVDVTALCGTYEATLSFITKTCILVQFEDCAHELIPLGGATVLFGTSDDPSLYGSGTTDGTGTWCFDWSSYDGCAPESLFVTVTTPGDAGITCTYTMAAACNLAVSIVGGVCLTVLGCYGSPLEDATVTITAYYPDPVTTGSDGVANFAGTCGVIGTAMTVVVSAARYATQTLTLPLTGNLGTVQMQPDYFASPGYMCCPGCDTPIATVLQLTDANGTHESAPVGTGDLAPAGMGSWEGAFNNLCGYNWCYTLANETVWNVNEEGTCAPTAGTTLIGYGLTYGNGGVGFGGVGYSTACTFSAGWPESICLATPTYAYSQNERFAICVNNAICNSTECGAASSQIVDDASITITGQCGIPTDITTSVPGPGILTGTTPPVTGGVTITE